MVCAKKADIVSLSRIILNKLTHANAHKGLEQLPSKSELWNQQIRHQSEIIKNKWIVNLGLITIVLLRKPPAYVIIEGWRLSCHYFYQFLGISTKLMSVRSSISLAMSFMSGCSLCFAFHTKLMNFSNIGMV